MDRTHTHSYTESDSKKRAYFCLSGVARAERGTLEERADVINDRSWRWERRYWDSEDISDFLHTEATED